MKTFASDVHFRSGGDKVPQIVILLSYFLLLASIAIVAAVGLSSISSVTKKLEANPGSVATYAVHNAALAGVSAAINHIQCHSYREAGGLPLSSFAEGGKFRVLWEKPNLEDSTVKITSVGLYQKDGVLLAQTTIDTLAHLDFFSPKLKAKMEKYYSQHTDRDWKK